MPIRFNTVQPEALDASYVDPAVAGAELKSIGLDAMFEGSIPWNHLNVPNRLRDWPTEPNTLPADPDHAPFELIGDSESIWTPVFYTDWLDGNKERKAVHLAVHGLRRRQGWAKVEELGKYGLGLAVSREERHKKESALADANAIVGERLRRLEPITAKDLQGVEEINALISDIRGNVRDRTSEGVRKLNRTIAREPKGIIVSCAYDGTQEAYKGKRLFAQLKGLRIVDDADFGIIQAVVAGKDGEVGLLPRPTILKNDYRQASDAEAKSIREAPAPA
ncbi:MAG: hypothetical protein AAB462_04340 [Patescibacteria group bacterium]